VRLSFIFFLHPVFYSTWTEFASDVNGKKLSKLIGNDDEEKLLDLCNLIAEQVQNLRPYQPITNSPVLFKLFCRTPTHDKQLVVDICPGDLLPCVAKRCSHIYLYASFRPWPAMQPLHVRSQPLGVQHQTSEAC
jgi:hypothetical protein